MSILDPTAIAAAAPEYKMDQIVAVITGSFAIGAGSTDAFNVVTPATAFDTKTPPSNDVYLFKGLWSVDGIAWQEFGNEIITGSYANGLRVLNVVASSGIDLSVNPNAGSLAVNATNYSASGYTIQYKLALLARFDQDNVTISQLPQVLGYASKNNYMKTFIDNLVVLNNSTTTVVPHNLGYVPNIAVWTWSHWDDGSGFPFIEMDEAGQSTTIDLANLTLPKTVSSASLKEEKAYYRIYLDK